MWRPAPTPLHDAPPPLMAPADGFEVEDSGHEAGWTGELALRLPPARGDFDRLRCAAQMLGRRIRVEECPMVGGRGESRGEGPPCGPGAALAAGEVPVLHVRGGRTIVHSSVRHPRGRGNAAHSYPCKGTGSGGGRVTRNGVARQVIFRFLGLLARRWGQGASRWDCDMVEAETDMVCTR